MIAAIAFFALYVGYWCLISVTAALLWWGLLALGDWFAPVPERPAPAPRPASRPQVSIGHYASTNPDHPHPLREPTLWVDADSEDAAWAVLERSVA